MKIDNSSFFLPQFVIGLYKSDLTLSVSLLIDFSDQLCTAHSDI